MAPHHGDENFHLLVIVYHFMGKKKKDKQPEESVDWDVSEGFGGIPNDIDLTKIIGCASSSGKKYKSSRKQR